MYHNSDTRSAITINLPYAVKGVSKLWKSVVVCGISEEHYQLQRPEHVHFSVLALEGKNLLWTELITRDLNLKVNIYLYGKMSKWKSGYRLLCVWEMERKKCMPVECTRFSCIHGGTRVYSTSSELLLISKVSDLLTTNQIWYFTNTY